MNSSDAWAFLAGLVILAIVAVLVRPGSKGPQAVKDISGAIVALLRVAVE